MINPLDRDLYDKATENITDTRLGAPIDGGATRSETVRLGLSHVDTEVVLIHDGARPLLPLDALERLITAQNHHRAAFLALPVTDALWRVKDQAADAAITRDNLWRAQTPQAFRTADLRSAYHQNNSAADDDVAIIQRAGHSAVPILGAERNIKITHPEDFSRAAAFIGDRMDIRTGIGYDVHALGEGDHVILNGISIPHSQAMIGHSDADVAMHALTDALFGALAEGDIGQWFPPADPQWKGASSDIFLRKAIERVHARGFHISNMDCTIICEMPKIGPHATAMRENLAKITGVDLERISVKATTSEKLGFTGRGEGIAAQATTTLVKI
ncbi:bifunctional enzyme IspD/IspF [Amylibacter marinus]|uniref:Bifunctional enzyme IspD/IspF n=1 Tax=Amylibacter marinus TaxID=1475483 RepID=A0ABQ5VSC2_9RHOB|nr:bifunctional enzyme IspD/IspF [Amylibacter marinus]